MIDRGSDLLSGKICFGESMWFGEFRRTRRAGSVNSQLFHMPAGTHSHAHDLNHILLLRISVTRAMCAMKCRRDVTAWLLDRQLKRLSLVTHCQRAFVMLLLVGKPFGAQRRPRQAF